MLALGGNDGTIGLYNVCYATDFNIPNLDAGLASCTFHPISSRKTCFSALLAHPGAVMDVYGVPGKNNELLSIGGDGTAKFESSALVLL